MGLCESVIRVLSGITSSCADGTGLNAEKKIFICASCTSPISLNFSISLNFMHLFLFCVVEQVLDHFYDRFVKDMDALNVIYELQRQDIISEGDQKEVKQSSDSKQQNQFLHQCLKKKCDLEALIKVCDVVVAVRGNPRLKSLGNDMKNKLTSKLNVYM